MTLPPVSLLSILLKITRILSLSSLALLSIASLLKAQTPSPTQPQTPSTPQPTAPIETRSPCDAFSTRQEAQAFFERNFSSAANLDPDQDGQACEQLSTSLRKDGYRISSGRTSDGWSYEIWRSSIRSSYGRSRDRVVYYVKAWRNYLPDTLLTTRTFPSAQESYDYFINQLK